MLLARAHAVYVWRENLAKFAARRVKARLQELSTMSLSRGKRQSALVHVSRALKKELARRDAVDAVRAEQCAACREIVLPRHEMPEPCPCQTDYYCLCWVCQIMCRRQMPRYVHVFEVPCADTTTHLPCLGHDCLCALANTNQSWNALSANQSTQLRMHNEGWYKRPKKACRVDPSIIRLIMPRMYVTPTRNPKPDILHIRRFPPTPIQAPPPPARITREATGRRATARDFGLIDKRSK